MESRWLSVENIAQYLGVVEDTVYRWIEHKGLPAHRVGKLWKSKTEEIDEWIKSGKAEMKVVRKRSRPLSKLHGAEARNA